MAIVQRFLESLTALSDGEDELTGRDVLWQASWILFLRKPIFGIGWSNTETYIRHIVYSSVSLSTHNIYLQLLTETGIVGALFFGNAFLQTIAYGYSTQRRINNEASKIAVYGHSILRPSCYECPYKSVMHPGDITIADYWGIEKAAPEFDDNKGVSLVLVNNEVGERAFERVKENLIWKQTKLEDSLQPPLKAPFPKPENREQFWSDFENKSFEYVAKKYGGIGLKNDAKSLLRKIKRKVKNLVSKGGKRNTRTI